MIQKENFVNYSSFSYFCLGFTELTNACCGTGRFNGEGPCTPNSNLCSNRDSHYSWDQYHPSQAVARLVSILSFYESLHVFPVNIQQLVNI
ncbi:putative triacylglycerol lipase [Dioscorea sansibarensis]